MRPAVGKDSSALLPRLGTRNAGRGPRGAGRAAPHQRGSSVTPVLTGRLGPTCSPRPHCPSPAAAPPTQPPRANRRCWLAWPAYQGREAESGLNSAWRCGKVLLVGSRRQPTSSHGCLGASLTLARPEKPSLTLPQTWRSRYLVP